MFYLLFDSLCRAQLVWLWNMTSVVWPRGWRCACFCAAASLFILVLIPWHYTIDCALWGVARERCELIWAARGLRQSLVKRCRPDAGERSLTGLSTRERCFTLMLSSTTRHVYKPRGREPSLRFTPDCFKRDSLGFKGTVQTYLLLQTHVKLSYVHFWCKKPC